MSSSKCEFGQFVDCPNKAWILGFICTPHTLSGSPTPSKGGWNIYSPQFNFNFVDVFLFFIYINDTCYEMFNQLEREEARGEGEGGRK